MSTPILTSFSNDKCSRCGATVAGSSSVLLTGGETFTHEPTEDYPDPVLHTMDWHDQYLLCADCSSVLVKEITTHPK